MPARRRETRLDRDVRLELEHHVAVDEEYVERQRAWRANTAALPPNIRLMLIVAEHLRRTHGFGCFARAMNRVPLIRSAYDEAGLPRGPRLN